MRVLSLRFHLIDSTFIGSLNSDEIFTLSDLSLRGDLQTLKVKQRL